MNATDDRFSTGPAAQADLQWFDRPPSPGEIAIVAAITAVATVLRFHELAAKPLWFDEGVSVAIARLGTYNFVRLLWHREANMSLYYLLLRPWLHFSQSEAFIRSLSVVFGVLAVPALYLLGRRLFDARVGLIAASLLCFHAYAIRYSQEARSYSLMLLLCVFSSLFFIEALKDPSQRKRLAYVLCSALAVYAHFFAGLLILAQVVSLRFLRDYEDGRAALRKGVRWLALLVAPIAIFAATTGAGPLRWIPRPGIKELWRFTLYLTGNAGPVLAVCLAVAAMAGFSPMWRERADLRVSWTAWRYRFLFLWLALPVLLVLAASIFRPLFLPRYFIFCVPALLLIAACGLSRIRPNWLMAGSIVIVLSLLLYGTASYYRGNLDRQRDDWRAVTRHVIDQRQPGDAIIFHVAMARMPFEYYRSLQPNSSRAPDVLYPNHGEQITYLDFVEKPDIPQLQQALASHPRVWLVLCYAETPSGPDATARTLENMLDLKYEHKQQETFPGLDVMLYTHNSGR